MAATKTTTLLDLAQNFEKYMFGYGIKPIAKGFTVKEEKTYGVNPSMYWEILAVRENGKYPCVGDVIRKYDQDSTVVIHHIDNK